MVDIVSVILAEYETIPLPLLEVLFSRIIDPEKVKANLMTMDEHVSFPRWRNFAKNAMNWSNRSFVEVNRFSKHPLLKSVIYTLKSTCLDRGRFILVFQGGLDHRRYGIVTFTFENLLHLRWIVSHLGDHRRGIDSNHGTSIDGKARLEKMEISVAILGLEWETSSRCSEDHRPRHQFTEEWFCSEVQNLVEYISRSVRQTAVLTESRLIDFRFKNGVPEVQLSCIKHLKSYFVNHPELRPDLEGNALLDSSYSRSTSSLSEVMGQLSLSADVNVRTQLMAQIRAITNGNLLDISDKIKQILCERARDKIVIDHDASFHQTVLTIDLRRFLVGSAQRSVGFSRSCL